MATATLTDFDVFLWNEGSHFRAYEKLGAHPDERQGTPGTRFAVWAPNARAVAVVGDFNGWDPRADPLTRGPGGVWERFVPRVGPGALYKYSILAPDGGSRFDKADPLAFAAEMPPGTAM